MLYIFAIVGMSLFGATALSAHSREHFDSFGPAMLTMVSVFSLGFVELAKACSQEVGLPLVLIYFGAALVLEIASDCF